VGPNGILKKGREILLTGCSLRTATEGSGKARLLPTEYIIVLLDEVLAVLVKAAISNHPQIIKIIIATVLFYLEI
jgi:Cell division control protein 24, OB domain 2